MTTINVDTDGVSGDYSTLSAAYAAIPASLSDDYTIECAATTGVADTTALTLSAKTLNGYTILIIASNGHEALKTGWSTSRYRLETTDEDTIKLNGVDVEVRGLQIGEVYSGTDYKTIVQTSYLASSSSLHLKNCVIRASGGNTHGINIAHANAIYNIENCIIITTRDAIRNATSGATATISNCVLHGDGADDGIETVSGTTTTVKNTSIFNFADDINNSGTITVQYNCADDDLDTEFSESTNIQPYGSDWDNEYNDSANNDFTLLNGGNCYLAGTPISGLTLDIEGDSYHVTTPSVGVDEYVDGGSSISVIHNHFRKMRN